MRISERLCFGKARRRRNIGSQRFADLFSCLRNRTGHLSAARRYIARTDFAFSKPAARTVLTRSVFDRPPAIQPVHREISLRASRGNALEITISPIYSLPPGFRTRCHSARVLVLSGALPIEAPIFFLTERSFLSTNSHSRKN